MYEPQIIRTISEGFQVRTDIFCAYYVRVEYVLRSCTGVFWEQNRAALRAS